MKSESKSSISSTTSLAPNPPATTLVAGGRDNEAAATGWDVLAIGGALGRAAATESGGADSGGAGALGAEVWVAARNVKDGAGG